MELKKADLHLHTDASDDHIDWPFRLPMKPILSPLETYTLAKSRGMDYVTFTDHDTIDGAMRLHDALGKWPADFFISEEITAAYPGLEHDIHVNAFDITPSQHDAIQRLPRLEHGIHVGELSKYLKREDILYSWNHPFWSSTCSDIAMRTLDEIAEHFGVVEVRNGTRRKSLCDVAETLAYSKQAARVGGSDSHTYDAGLTYTLATGETPREFLESIRKGESAVEGLYGTEERFVRDTAALMKTNFRRAAQRCGIATRAALNGCERLGQLIAPTIVRTYHRKQDRNLGRLYT
jgi:hypothetical protein